MVQNFDKIFNSIGQCGRYQIFLYFLLGLVAFISGWLNLVIIFVAGNQDHWCRIPELANYSFADQKTIAIPAIVGGSYSHCKKYDFNYTVYSVEEILSWNRSSGNEVINSTDVVECGKDGWTYDTTWWLSTIVEQFDLVCKREWIVAITTTVFMTGMLVGCVGFGALADKFGRHKVLLLNLALHFAFGLAAAFSPNVLIFAMLRFLCGMAAGGGYTTAFVLIMELNGPKHRTKLGIWVQGFFGLGFTTLPGLAYFIRNHVTLQIVIASPCLLLLSYYWLIPESPRWLMTQGRYEEAERIARKFARLNRRSVSKKIKLTEGTMISDDNKKDKDKDTANILDLLRTPNIRRQTFCVVFIWLVNSLVYYGLSFSSGSFGDNIYLNIFLGGLVELPAYVVTMLLLDRFGRRVILISFMVAGGAACLGCMPLLPHKTSPVLLSIAMFGKFCISASFAIIYLWTAEIYPTVVRTVGVGSGSMAARFGGLLAPQVALLVKVWEPLPTLLFGILSIMAGLLALLLPETLNRQLPETLEEGEKLGRISSLSDTSDKIMMKASPPSKTSLDEEEGEMVPENRIMGELPS
ncbi:organic cation transporter protein-like isoform X2 [Lineus longissimus]